MNERSLHQWQLPDVAATPEQLEHKRLERALLIFDKKLKITLERESAVILLTFQHRDREVAVAALDVLLVLATLVWGIIAIYPFVNWVAYIQIPYLLCDRQRAIGIEDL